LIFFRSGIPELKKIERESNPGISESNPESEMATARISVLSLKGSWEGPSLDELSLIPGATCRGKRFRKVDPGSSEISRVDLGKFQFFRKSWIVLFPGHMLCLSDDPEKAVERANVLIRVIMEKLSISYTAGIYNICAKFRLPHKIDVTTLESFKTPYESLGFAGSKGYGVVHLKNGVNIDKNGQNGTVTKAKSIEEVFELILSIK